ncbi:TRAP transporter small permease [Aquibium sp. LZ166]|uniref:TRAP transporter small permease protein n=1 Tax=Aquibium pacificus TaxID=3153579 RepID=A0ABV3SS06_9HYPH
MTALDRAASILSAFAALIAGTMLVAMVGHTILEMVLRAFFNTSTFVLDEFVGYEVAALTMLGLGHALNTGGLIRVNLLTRLLGTTAQRRVELAVVILVFALCLYLSRYHLLAIEAAYARGTRSNTLAQTPLWLPLAVFVAGLVIFMIQLLAYALRLLGGGNPIRDNHESA